MRTTIIVAAALIFSLGTFFSTAQSQVTDSLKVKNEIKSQNKGEEQKLKVRTQEQTQTEKPENSGTGKKVSTCNQGENEKLRVRTEEGDKAKGQAVQTRFRDENSDGIPDLIQAKKQEGDRNRIRLQEKKHGDCRNMTPHGCTSCKQNKRGSGQAQGSGRP